MPTRLEQFAAHLHKEVQIQCGENTSPREREEAFTECVLQLLSEHNEADGADVCLFEARNVGRVPAAKLNAWSLSGDGATLDLFVAQFHDSGKEEEVGKSELKKHFQLLRGFLRRALDGFHSQMKETENCFSIFRDINCAKDTLATVRLFFLTDGVVRSLDIEEEGFPGLDVRYVVWDLDKLSRLHVGHREVIEVDLVNDYGGAVPCLQAADPTGEYRTFLAFFPAPLLAQIYGQHGQRLLERNVRAFLQAKGKVNRGLQKTLKEEPHRFLAYNNGLCCTAAEVRVQSDGNGHTRLELLKDFQIVNGGQTTASIFHAVKKEKVNVDPVVVQVKITVLKDAATVNEMVPLISRYANSQNKVNAADFSANGPFHHALEQLSRTVWAPATSGLERGTHWYYERARGSYPDDKSRQGSAQKQKEWESQNPQHQKFTKTDLAKFEHAWLGWPHLVCMGAEKNFVKMAERMNDDGEPVVDENYFKSLVAKAILVRTAEKLFSLQELEGYRANSVAYAISWLAEKSGRRIDLDRIWREQRLSPALCDALKTVCSHAHRHITAQEGNPGEVSKRETCWNAFKVQDIEIPSEWQAELATKAFLVVNDEEQALEQEWERIRPLFANDSRTIGELEVATGKVWMPTRRSDPIYHYVDCPWPKLRNQSGMGLKRLKGLVQLFSAASS